MANNKILETFEALESIAILVGESAEVLMESLATHHSVVEKIVDWTDEEHGELLVMMNESKVFDKARESVNKLSDII